MKLSSSDLFLLCQCAISAAYQAGQIILKNTDQPISVSIKKGGVSLASQVITEVDHLCQAIILQALLPICERYDLALLTEESPDNLERLEKDFFWCIDPLDGTLPFVESSSGYAVSIALVSRNGMPYIGVIYDPVDLTLYYAIKGFGAFRNGQPWKFETIMPRNSLTLITDRSFGQHPLFSQVMMELKDITATIGFDGINTIQHGGAVMNACWVLENNPACYFKFPKPQEGGGSLWDYAATACFFLEVGAVVSDIYGKPLELNRPDSTFLNHRGVLYTYDYEMARQIMDLYTKVTRNK